jgi:antitoxin HicB
MQSFAYPIALTEDSQGGYVVTCRDIPEVVTQGESPQDACEAAEGALQAAIEMRIHDGEQIPAASRLRRGEFAAAVPITTAMKAALHLVMREQGISKSELARRLGVDEKEARRMLDPGHGTKVPSLEHALRILGKRPELRVV